jgi:hypothetical protein
LINEDCDLETQQLFDTGMKREEGVTKSQTGSETSFSLKGLLHQRRMRLSLIPPFLEESDWNLGLSVWCSLYLQTV